VQGFDLGDPVNDVDTKRLLDSLAQVKEEERVLACLPSDYCDRLLQQHNAHQDIESLQHKLKRMMELVQAKQVIFWEDLKNLIEQADSSSSRGLSIGVRKDRDGRVVLVEFKDDKPDHPLMKLFGMGG
jgi:hypothetical protein